MFTTRTTELLIAITCIAGIGAFITYMYVHFPTGVIHAVH